MTSLLQVDFLGVILRVHREHRYLRRIFRQIRKLRRNVKHVTVCLAADRPSAQVLFECDRAIRNAAPGLDIFVYEVPQVLTSEGQNWMAPIAAAYNALLARRKVIHAAMLWDDDALLSPNLLRELRGHLQCLEYDRLEAESLFLWDQPSAYNALFPRHFSTVLFRVHDGDQFPLDYITHSPDRVARSSSYAVLNSVLLNSGYMDSETRGLQWQRCKETGRIDGHTLTLTRDPELRAVPASR